MAGHDSELQRKLQALEVELQSLRNERIRVLEIEILKLITEINSLGARQFYSFKRGQQALSSSRKHN